VISRTDRLRGVLDDRDIPTAGDLADAVDLGALAEQVDGDDGPGLG
jgi:hypothetical protein